MAKLKIHPNPSSNINDEFNSSAYPKSGAYLSNNKSNDDFGWVLLVCKDKGGVILVNKDALEAVVVDSLEDYTPVGTIQNHLGISINDVLRLIAIKSDSANIEDILEK